MGKTSSATVLTSSCWLGSPNFLVWPRLLGIEKVDFNELDLVSIDATGGWEAGTDTVAGISGAINWGSWGACVGADVFPSSIRLFFLRPP